MNDLADTIRNVPLFSGLPREDIAKILGKLEEKSFAAGATVFSQGEKGDSFYIVQSGAVQVVLQSAGGRSEVISVLGPQDCFGEMALLSGEPRSATIIAVKETTVWRLSREDWDELIEKHPTWLLHFCATLSRRLTHAEKQYSQGRDAFNTLAEEFYGSRPAEEQKFQRRACLLTAIDPKTVDQLVGCQGGEPFLDNLRKSQLPFLQSVDGGKFELHGFFRDFLLDKLVATEGNESIQPLQAQIAEQYEQIGAWDQAIHHWIEAQNWPRASELLAAHRDELLDGSAASLKKAVDRIPPDYFFSDLRLVRIKADLLAHLGDPGGAIRTFKEVLSQRGSAVLGEEAVARYHHMADLLLQKKEQTQALNVLRSAVSLLEQETAALSGDISQSQTGFYWQKGPDGGVSVGELPAARRSVKEDIFSFLSRLNQKGALSRWFGAVLGLGLFVYLWFWTPDIGLDQEATKLLGLLSFTLVYWVFWVLPDYGVALIFALGLILSGLGKAEMVLGGFASTTWFMTLGVLGLGAAITSSGLFYRLSLQLVKFVPLTYYWQIIALGFMGIVVMALIPQQSARTAIISQMLVNLSESLGYKNPSKASTGMFAASFLGLGQLGFLFLTGSTTSLIAWGLLPADVRAQFTWGYWFLAALPPTLIVTALVLLSIIFLYRPESQAQVSYRMVRNQLEILGPLSRNEWITLGVLVFTMTGWLTISYHRIDGAWISLAALCILVNTGVLGWGLIKKGIDWELLIYMGVTLSIPALLTKAKIDEWLVSFISPLILPFVETPAISFLIIALITYALKLLFTSFLTVVTLCVALLPLSVDMGISPWLMSMIILTASEVWFFRFQVDWHTLSYSTTEGKGFTYPLMSRINPFYALAYLLALVAAIPYWRYLGLVG